MTDATTATPIPPRDAFQESGAISVETVTEDAAAANESVEAEEASADIAEQAGADEGRAKNE